MTKKFDGSIPSDTSNIDAVLRALSPVCYAKRWVLVCRLTDELVALRKWKAQVLRRIPKSELNGWGICE